MSLPKTDWRIAILAVYALVVGFVMVSMGRPSEAGWFLMSIPFMLLALAPVALLCFGKRRATAKGVGAIVVAILGVAAYYHTAFIAAPDAQGGLVFLFAPLYQFMLAFVWLLAIWAIDRFRGKDPTDA
ncbi:hypothetical protein [Qipengyuania spongiae]|uniref:DUF2069 domain-containing protein n=1 Tax=Qipengyuania spongiae TaxID=2909673 RepID=A0ABY5T304_9SPHN|nr:hypothetical protein [Qipengyuania spongiae]UVI39364.1 hypothetical protein L1F33_14230 [Qipengyuania spongiae]